MPQPKHPRPAHDQHRPTAPAEPPQYTQCQAAQQWLKPTATYIPPPGIQPTAKRKRFLPSPTDRHHRKVAPTWRTGQPPGLPLYRPTKQGQYDETKKRQHMPAYQLCRQPFRDKLHLGQLASMVRYSVVSIVYHTARFGPLSLWAALTPILVPFTKPFGPSQAFFPSFYVPNVRRLPRVL